MNEAKKLLEKIKRRKSIKLTETEETKLVCSGYWNDLEEWLEERNPSSRHFGLKKDAFKEVFE